MKNKKAEQGISWQIIAIILVVLVLVVFAFGLFFVLKESKGRLSEDNNVDLIVKECQIACLSQASDDYCLRQRKVYSEDNSLNGIRTCEYLESKLDDLDCRNLKC